MDDEYVKIRKEDLMELSRNVQMVKSLSNSVYGARALSIARALGEIVQINTRNKAILKKYFDESKGEIE